VPTTAGRRVGIVVVLVLLVAAAALALVPFGAGAVRVGGLSILWWYAAVVAPCTVALVTMIVLFGRRPSNTDAGPPPSPSP
jgi:hypothetical protein